jgi:hypothetical protein
MLAIAMKKRRIRKVYLALASGTAMPDSLWWVTRSIRRVEFPVPTVLMISGPRRLAAPDLRELTPDSTRPLAG